MEGNYEKVLSKISKASGESVEELERRVEAKRAKLAGLISREGAAQVVAAELGVSFENEKSKINELLSGMRKVNVVGQVLNISPVRTFVRNGKEGKVVSFLLADESSNIKVVLWDMNHIELIENQSIKEGSVVEILNASMRDNELHLGSFSEFKLSNEIFEKVFTEKVVKDKCIKDFKIADSVSTRAFVLQAFEPKFFNVCPECKKKPTSEGDKFVCKEHGNIVPEKRALMNIVLDDGTETIRSVLFHDNLSEIGITELDNPERLTNQKDDLLGKEMIFCGDVRNNKFFNTPEFVISEVKEVNLDEVIKILEK